MSKDSPEPGTRVKVETDEGSEVAIFTGHAYASEDGSRLIDNVKSWEEAPQEGELEIIGAPEQLPAPPTPEADDGDEEE